MTQNPYAWPRNWRESGDYVRLYMLLVTQHGDERTLAITNGKDERTNEDLDKWRGLGRR